MSIKTKTLAGAVAVLMGMFVGPASGMENSPNIVVILTDDQGFADISLNPHHGPEVSTPPHG